jgi:hypothetical protein
MDTVINLTKVMTPQPGLHSDLEDPLAWQYGSHLETIDLASVFYETQ